MKEPKIEKNKPLIRKFSKVSFDWDTFLKKLKIGDSFVSDKTSSIKVSSYRIGIVISMRKDKKDNHYRFWRIK